MEDFEKGVYTKKDFEHGDLLSLYFQGSHNFKLAYEGGNGKLHTHAGIVVEENGQKYVVHTVEDRRRVDKLEDVLSGKAREGKNRFMVVEIIRPDYDLSKEKIVKLDEPIYDISSFTVENYYRGNVKSLQSKTGYELLACLKENRYIISKAYGFTEEETNEVLSLSMAIFGNESTFGDGEYYWNEAQKEKNNISIYQIIRNIADVLGYDDISRGIGQMKEEITLKDAHVLFKDMDMYSVQYAASATPFVVSAIYKHIKNSCGKNNVLISKQNLFDITLCVYNRGWDSDSYTKPVEDRLIDYRDGLFSIDEYGKFNYVVNAKSTLRNVKFDFYKPGKFIVETDTEKIETRQAAENLKEKKTYSTADISSISKKVQIRNKKGGNMEARYSAMKRHNGKKLS